MTLTRRRTISTAKRSLAGLPVGTRHLCCRGRPTARTGPASPDARDCSSTASHPGSENRRVLAIIPAPRDLAPRAALAHQQRAFVAGHRCLGQDVFAEAEPFVGLTAWRGGDRMTRPVERYTGTEHRLIIGVGEVQAPALAREVEMEAPSRARVAKCEVESPGA